MTAPVKQCKDCVAEGITTKRKPVLRNGKPVPGYRCATHWRSLNSSRKDTAWERRLMDVYGLSADEYWAIYEYQGGRCYICRRGTGASKRLSVDHCHETGMVRGLLDTACNKWVLGMLRDDVDAFQRAIDYLTNPPAKEVIGCRIVPLTGAPVKGNTQRQAGAKPITTEPPTT